MAKPPINPKKIVVFSGAGISAPSGLATFRDKDGLWDRFRIEDVATPEAWSKHPDVVLDFYNERRAQANDALPNEAHRAIAGLQAQFDVIVVTQNVDDLHERAGSRRVIHLHGELTKARSTADSSLIYDIGAAPIRIGDRCAKGSQLRPHIVWFGEDVQRFDESAGEILSAGRLLVVGTSLTVFPAAGLLKFARYGAEKILVDLEAEKRPRGFKVVRGSAEKVLPILVERWLGENGPKSPIGVETNMRDVT